MVPFLLLPLCTGCLFLALIPAAPVAFVFMTLLGVSSAFTAALSGSLWPELYGSRHIGAIRSVAFALMVFSSAAGPGLVGVLIDAGVSFDHQLLAMSGYCAAMTAVLVVTIRKLRKR
jgi:MFS family permease